jgi:hypothetical protein
MKDNSEYKKLVDENIFIEKDLSKKFILYLNENNSKKLDYKFSKCLTIKELDVIKKKFNSFKKGKVLSSKSNRNENIYQFITKIYDDENLLNKLRTNNFMKVRGSIPSLASIIINKDKFIKYIHDNSNASLREDFKELIRLCNFQNPKEIVLREIIDKINKAQQSNKKQCLILFTPACPDYSKILIKNNYRYTFKKLGTDIGLVAQRVLEEIDKIENFMKRHKINYKHIISIGDFEAFSEKNQKGLKLSQSEFLQKVKKSQRKINNRFKKFKFIESKLFTNYFGGKKIWIDTRNKYKKLILSNKFGNSDLKNENLDEILESRIKLYTKWYGKMSKNYFFSILIDQAAEYATMGELISKKFKNSIILGADHHKMIDFYRIYKNIPVVYLKKKYIT